MTPGFALTKGRGALALVLLALLLYASSLGGGFVWDDEYNYLDNPVILKQTVRAAFTSDIYAFLPQRTAQQYYRPLHVLTYSWLARASGLHPFALHLASVAVHALAGVLAFLLLGEMIEIGAAWFAAALFLAHPLHVEAVAWMASFSEILTATLMLLSLYLLVRARRGHGTWIANCGLQIADFKRGERRPVAMGKTRLLLLGFSYAAAFAAFLTKETSLILPVMAAGLVGLASWPFFVLAGGYLGMRYAVLGLAAAALPPRGIPAHLATVLSAALQYTKKLVWPWPLAPEYSPYHSAAAWAVFALAGAIGAWAAWRFKAPGRLPGRLSAGPQGTSAARVRLALLFCLPLVPALAGSLMLPPLRLTQDRYAYLAVLGFVLLIAHAARTRGGAIVCLVLLLAWSALSLAAIPHWHDNEVLWSHTLRVTPESKTAVLGLGSWYYETGRLPEAEALYRDALQRRPADPDYLTSLQSVQKVMRRQRDGNADERR